MKKLKRDYLLIKEIYEILDKLKDNTDNEMDGAILDDSLNAVRIQRIAAERITIRRIKNIFTSALEEIKEEN